MIRLALIPILVLAFVISVGGVARAETDGEQVADPGTELFRQALADYRTALAELRELCTAGDDDAGVATARRRAPKELSACQRGMRELKSFLVEVRKTAHWVREKAAEDREAKKVAKEEERKAKEREEQEQKDSERKSAEESARAAEKAAEKAKQQEKDRLAEKAKQAEKSKQQEQQKTNAVNKDKSSYERELAEMRKQLQAELNDWAKGERAANEYGLLAGTKTGEERAKYEQKAAYEKQHAAEHHALALRLQAKIAEYEKGLGALPKSTEVAKKAQKLRDQIRGLEDTIAYKRGLEQDALDRASEYRAIADEKSGAEREKYLYKAAEMDRQADEWARYASDYEEQRDRAQAELDALGL